MAKLTVAPFPFKTAKEQIILPEGLSVGEMAACYLAPYGMAADAVVMIGDWEVPEEMWDAVHPKEGTEVLINIVPQGGKGGKNPIGALITIATLVAAPYLAPSLGATLGLSVTGAGVLTAGQTAFYQGLVRLGIGAVGFLASSMLSSVPKQRSSTPDLAESPTQFIEGASNSLNPYGVVPVCLGTNRMFPPQAARPYTETAGAKQYVRQLFTFGFGQNLIRRNARLGETALSSYTDVFLEERMNGNLHVPTTVYPNDVFQDAYSVLLSNVASWVERTTQPNTEEASIDFTFQQGLTQYDDNGNRGVRTVDMAVEYAPVGSSDWSAGVGAFKAISAQTQSVEPAVLTGSGSTVQIGGNYYEVASYLVGVSINQNDGTMLLTRATGVLGMQLINIPATNLRVATLTVERRRLIGTSTITDVVTVADNRDPSYYGTRFQNTSSFVTTATGLSITVSAGGLQLAALTYSASTSEALRVSYPVRFPYAGQWKIRVRRVTADADDTKTLDKVFLTAIRSINYRIPVTLTGLCGTAIRMMATDQLNGSIEQYNEDVSNVILDYRNDSGLWVLSETSNCASIFRYVCQSPAFAKRLSDSQINLEKLAEWHDYCRINDYTYNRVIDYETSFDDLLADIAAAGMASPDRADGIYSVIIDKPKETITQLVTPRNSWGYNGTIAWPKLPDALRIEFRNKDKGYTVDERIVYMDGYDESNAVLFERLQFLSCDNSGLAWKYGRRYLANAILQPEIHNFTMDVENLVAQRGDRIKFVSDVILVGVGQARIKQMIYDDPDTPTQILGFIVDDTISIPNTNTFACRVRHNVAGSYTYGRLQTVVGETNTFMFRTPIDGNANWRGLLVSFTEDGEEKDLLITAIDPQANLTARITAVDYAPERFNADQGDIPAWQSNMTVPLEFIAPNAPILAGEILSNESVMLRNSDGSYTGRMVIPLQNTNGPDVIPTVGVRMTGSNVYSQANILDANPSQLILTGFEDGAYYDIQIRYRRPNGHSLSAPLTLTNVQYLGATGIPANVTGFKITMVNDVGLAEWNANSEIDISHYRIKFSPSFTDVDWSNAQLLTDNISDNRLSLVYRTGTYLIKAVDIMGNESASPAVVQAINGGALKNVIAELIEDPDFNGTKVNTHVYDGQLWLIDPTLPGEYYFDNTIDLGETFESFVSASVVAYGANYQRIRSLSSIRSVASIRGTGQQIRSLASIRSTNSIRGINPSDWSVVLQFRTTTDDPSGTPVWTAWQQVQVGFMLFRAIEFRLLLTSNNPNVSPRVPLLRALIDMPDRNEFDKFVSCPPAGVTIIYPGAFLDDPSVNITIQDGAVDDRLEFISKDRFGFTLKIWNATVSNYVTRRFDYLSAGYGRQVS